MSWDATVSDFVEVLFWYVLRWVRQPELFSCLCSSSVPIQEAIGVGCLCLVGFFLPLMFTHTKDRSIESWKTSSRSLEGKYCRKQNGGTGRWWRLETGTKIQKKKNAFTKYLVPLVHPQVSCLCSICFTGSERCSVEMFLCRSAQAVQEHSLVLGRHLIEFSSSISWMQLNKNDQVL